MNYRLIVHPDGEAGIPWASYSYSLDGRRVGKEYTWEENPSTDDLYTVHYLYVDMNAQHSLEFRNSFRINGQNVLYEFGQNHPTVRYTHPVACDGGVCGPTAHFFVDAPISITVDGEKYFYLYDGLGSVTELIDEDESVVNRYRYTVFGESRYKEEEVFNPYQYTGRRYDEETGQYYYRARMYSPVQSRFLSNDPMGMVDGPNMYMYVRNDPVNLRDPTGRWNVFWGPPMLINGWGGPWCPTAALDYKHGHYNGGGNGGEPPAHTPPDAPYGTFEYLSYTKWGIRWYYGYKWSFTREETAAISDIASVGSDILDIFKIFGLFILASKVAAAILAYIIIVTAICQFLDMGTAVYYTHIAVPFAPIPPGIGQLNFICD